MTNNFIPPHPLNTPVLFLVFNRPDVTKQVFDEIKKANPPRLYVAADGARKDKIGELEKVEQVRQIATQVDWDCEVKTLFREENFGCGKAVSSAITWFFENEEMGIILEDDCLPSQSFFWFCEELLVRYKDDMRVGEISGDNFQNGIKRGDGDYYFSIYHHIWGWASWANRWKNYDVDLNSIENDNFINALHTNKTDLNYWKNVFKQMKQKKIDTWDYQWTFTLWNNNQLTILPNINLIKNIGFGANATHTTGENEFANLKAYEIVVKHHPKEIVQNYEADDFTSKLMFSKKSIFEIIVNKVKRYIK